MLETFPDPPRSSDEVRAWAARLRSAKRRGRRACTVGAARQVLDEGWTPTLADAAERALVSRATAYRYSSSQEALLEELQLKIALGVMVGVESTIVLEDIYVPEREQAREVMDRAVRALVRAALAGGGNPGPLPGSAQQSAPSAGSRRWT